MPKLNLSKYTLSIIAISLMLPAVHPGLANSAMASPTKQGTAGKAGSAAKDPEKFMLNYYAVIHSATKLEDLLPYYRKEQLTEMEKMKKEVPPAMNMDKLMLEMMRSEQPKTLKIISKKVTADRAEYKLEPGTLSADQQALKAQGNFSMTGEVILVKEDGNWKVYKDYWKSSTKDKNGSSSSSFGINPDKSKEKGNNIASDSKPDTFDKPLKNAFFKDWKDAKGKGDVYVALKFSTDGKIEETHVLSKEGKQEEAVATIKKLFADTKDLPPLDAEHKDKPYAWMTFNWNEKGVRAVSGPYFDNEYPGWILEKIDGAVAKNVPNNK